MTNCNEKKERVDARRSLINSVFSWSIDDILDDRFYNNQVKKIPSTFSSAKEYLNSFETPLLEEIHADLSSSVKSISRNSLSRQAYSARISKDFKHPKDFFYSVVLRPTKEKESLQCGDLIAITDSKPSGTEDLVRSFVVGYVQWVKEDGLTLSVLLSSSLGDDDDDYDVINWRGSWKRGASFFMTQLINLTTNVRIWQALTSDPNGRNMKLIEKVLQPQFLGEEEKCMVCRHEQSERDRFSEVKTMVEASELNESQRNAVLSCVESGECDHRATLKLIWGPPGTGKTKTVGFLLHSLLGMKRRTLTCAPTNIAVLEVTERLVKKVIESRGHGNYGLGDIVLFGNKERMKIEDRAELCDVFLDNRVDVLEDCFRSEIGWTKSLLSVISLLEDPRELRCSYLREKEAKTRDCDDEKEDPDSSFMEFLKRRISIVSGLFYTCSVALCKHLPTSLLSPEEAKMMFAATESLKSFESSLKRVSDEEFEKVFGDDLTSTESRFRDCRIARTKTLFILKLLPTEFPVADSGNSLSEGNDIREFLLANACLIFCTVSSSAKLHTKGMIPFEYLVIDEAAQLKECESAIPLQLPGVSHAVFIGDERQLPAMIQSKIANKAGFGRSLFERLASLGHKKHLLNIQHRMHPSISSFPNQEFYAKKIFDGPNVKTRSYKKIFLPGKMFGTYSFINVAHGNELAGNNHSTKNMVEVYVISEIIASLYKEAESKKKKVRVGVISPYKAQVQAICNRFGKKYSSDPGSEFSVSVRSVDGFQGGEEDVIIISTVRSNKDGSLGFLSNLQRANVGLTRARHCLWIVGNGDTLSKRKSVWKNLINDAKQRRCFHNADEDKNLGRAIVSSLVDLSQLKAPPKFLTHLFKQGKWEVQFDNAFWTSMARTKDFDFCNKVLSLLDKLSGGWRVGQNKKGKTNLKFLECYEVKQMFLLWAVDISHHTQVIKVWNIVERHNLSRMSTQLEAVYESHSSDKINRCKYKRTEEDLVVPMRWAVESDSDSLSESLGLLRLRAEA